MVNIITVERAYGCGGGEMAQLLANRIGCRLWDQRLTEEIARLANCPKVMVQKRGERNDLDRERADFIEKYFKVEWPDCAIEHTMLNIEIGKEAVVPMILSSMQTYEVRVAA